MYCDVTEAQYIEGYKLKLTFENGKIGVVDFKDYAKEGTVYAHFSDMKYFRQFYINRELGILCWPGEVDVAPETLYSEATGEPLPAWMTWES